MKPYAFGVDLGGTTVKLGLFKTDGELLEKWEIPTRRENQGEHILGDIAEAILGKLDEKWIPVAQVQGVGMGVPGAVKDHGYVKPCVNLNQWGGFHVSGRLYDLIKIPVRVVNDANAAALGEMVRGGGKGRKNVLFVTLGTGVGGGVIIGGQLISGFHGAAGEIGHIKVNAYEEDVCGCGKRGCLEQYASATGLLRCTKKYLAANDTPTALRDFPALSCKDIFDCARGGDEAAVYLVDEMTRMLGMALATVSCVCDPQVIVIGGGVARAGSIITDGLKRHFKDYAFPATEETEFALAELGNDAGIYGCLQLILE